MRGMRAGGAGGGSEGCLDGPVGLAGEGEGLVVGKVDGS